MKKSNVFKRSILSLAIMQAITFSHLVQSDITVDSTADNDGINGNCTLREAIEAANTDLPVDNCAAGIDATVDPDFIDFDNSLIGSTITLGGTQLEITSDNILINGDIDNDGVPDIEINADGASRVFNINANNYPTYNGIGVSLRGLTISGGSAFNGGGIFTEDTTLELRNSIISGNATTTNGTGGGIYGYNNNISMQETTITDNDSDIQAGGIYHYGGSLTLVNSTVSGNNAGSQGGGILAYNTGTTVTLKNSTVSGNSAISQGGGVLASGYTTLTLHNSTVSGNAAGTWGGMYASRFDDVHLSNSIIANNTNGDCGSGKAVITNINNLIEDGGADCGITPLLSVDPELGVLSDNGGVTQTHLPAATSPVIDAADNTDCGTGKTVDTDQRGLLRDDASCDMGAIEVTPTIHWETSTVVVSEDGISATLNVIRSGNSNSEVSVDYITGDNTAIAQDDFTAATNTLSFASGDVVKTINIDINNDDIVEGDESFSVTLSNVQLISGVKLPQLNDPVQLVTVTDDDSAVSTDDDSSGDSSNDSSNEESSSSGALSLWSILFALPLLLWRRLRF